MARPRKELNQEEFESLLAIQCSLAEVTAYFDHKLGGCSEDTVERWCERTYGERFAEVAPNKREYGKIGLRRSAFELGRKNAAVCIFLCKNYLGLTDKQEITVPMNGKLEELIDGLREPFDDLHAETTGNDGVVANESTATD